MLIQKDRTVRNLQGVHPLLSYAVIAAAVKLPHPYSIISGFRTPAQQKELYLDRKSWTLQSKHVEGLAVDFAAFDEDGNYLSDNASKRYSQFADTASAIAADAGTRLRWGGNWAVRDYSHIEIDR